jgi:quinol monooxygenase YgiN
MDIPPDKVDATMLSLRSLVERIRAEAGCVDCSVYMDTEIRNRIVFIQLWRNEADLQRHLRSEEYQMILLIMETAVTPPKIKFNTISETHGFEIIEEARKAKKD